MRQLYKIAAFGLAGLFLTGCADTTIDYYPVDKPQSIAEYEYLDAYGPLKEYIDRAAHPGFLLGAGVSASDYINKGLIYRMTNANFDQITAGNEMKYASIVSDNGAMDFSTVEAFVEAAQAAGMSIYGHTLCWHAQQNTKYLNGLIADKELDIDPDAQVAIEDFVQNYDMDKFPYYVMGYEPEIIDGILTVPTYPDGWYQFFVMDGLHFKENTEYTVTARIRGSEPGQLNVQLGDWSNLEAKTMSFTDEWEEQTVTFSSIKAESGFSVFQPGTYPGKLEIDWVKLSHSEAPVMEIGVSLLSNGDADNGESDNLIARVPGQADFAAKVVDDPAGTGKVFESTFNADPATEWDSQFFIKSNESLPAGTKIHVKFRYRCTETRSIDTQAHGNPGEYHHWAFIGTLNATTDWKEHEYTGEISAEQAGDSGCSSIAFNLCKNATAGSLYIDDVVFEKMISANSIPLSDEEKYDILEAEMDRWIKGMMDATKGYVKAWDVVNEAISGAGNPRYDLQHGTGNPNDFFWQDYLGDNFVRIPVKYARKYYAEQEGANPSDLKLFINDYNLESDWDDNKKLKSLIEWINQWESDGETVIDGIGTQMHISYHLNPQTQKSKEDHIVKMFELMAATGKLCRITELDMGLVDENGQSVKTEDVTFEQHQLMAEHYKWIIQKYFEIIPVAQQYGICQWAQTDSPANSGWRGGEPIGLWNLNNQRKPTYGGFAEGLQGK